MVWGGITLIESLLEAQIEVLIMFVIFCAGLIIYAVDFTKGVVLNFLAFMCLFVIFYALGWEWRVSLIVMIMHLIVMAFTIWASAKKEQKGGLV